ncbi:YIP1 family protein [Cognatishimia sp. WU-CL00825]|uniref:YIP1 family protein n=1 Tax=Cognatishimia sp. WU-CL00825 TaxID=3127658 RepID=UPI003109C581
MSIVRDILATYRGPRSVFARRFNTAPREDRALALIMAACGVIFVAQWPKVAREAHFTGQELNPLMGGQLLLWVFIMPLFFYVISILVQIVMRFMSIGISGYASRGALFWALLSITPIALFRGLIGGFIGAGPVYDAIGLISFTCFFWFWYSGLAQARKFAA